MVRLISSALLRGSLVALLAASATVQAAAGASDPYQYLGATVLSTDEEIVKLYEEAMRGVSDPIRLVELHVAYHRLTDEAARCRYHRDTGLRDWYGVPVACGCEAVKEKLTEWREALEPIQRSRPRPVKKSQTRLVEESQDQPVKGSLARPSKGSQAGGYRARPVEEEGDYTVFGAWSNPSGTSEGDYEDADDAEDSTRVTRATAPKTKPKFTSRKAAREGKSSRVPKKAPNGQPAVASPGTTTVAGRWVTTVTKVSKATKSTKSKSTKSKNTKSTVTKSSKSSKPKHSQSTATRSTTATKDTKATATQSTVANFATHALEIVLDLAGVAATGFTKIIDLTSVAFSPVVWCARATGLPAGWARFRACWDESGPGVQIALTLGILCSFLSSIAGLYRFLRSGFAARWVFRVKVEEKEEVAKREGEDKEDKTAATKGKEMAKEEEVVEKKGKEVKKDNTAAEKDKDESADDPIAGWRLAAMKTYEAGLNDRNEQLARLGEKADELVNMSRQDLSLEDKFVLLERSYELDRELARVDALERQLAIDKGHEPEYVDRALREDFDMDPARIRRRRHR